VIWCGWIAPDELERALSLDMARRFAAIFSPGIPLLTLDRGRLPQAHNEVLKLKS